MGRDTKYQIHYTLVRCACITAQAAQRTRIRTRALFNVVFHKKIPHVRHCLLASLVNIIGGS